MTPGRVLLFGYGVFVIAAGSRSAVQLLTQPGRAPLAYALSVLAAVVYLIGWLILHQVESGRTWQRAAGAWFWLELAGVFVVGTLTVVKPDAFHDDTVWSRFGQGYGYVPLVLPLISLIWLHRRTPAAAPLAGKPGRSRHSG